MVAGICYAAHALILIAIGLRYVRSKEFLPYHAMALGRDWNSLDPALQVLLLAFIRGIGATLIAIAISTLSLLIFLFPEGVPASAPPCERSRSIAQATGAPTPVNQAWITIGLTPVLHFLSAPANDTFILRHLRCSDCVR